MKIIRRLLTIETILLGFIISIGLFLRVSHGDLNFWQDEFYTAMAVQGVLQTGLPYMPSDLLYIRAFPYTYAIAFIQLIVPFSEFSIRSLSIIIGITSLMVCYSIIRTLTNKWFALLAVFLVAISPWHITYSLLARSYIAQALLFLLICWNYVRYLEKHTSSYLAWNIGLTFLNALLTPITVLCLFMVLYVMWYRRYIENRPFDGKDLALLGTNCLVGFVGFIIPSAIPAWSQELSANAYSLTQVRSVVLLNLYFWKSLLYMFPVGAIYLFFSSIYLWFHNKKLFLFPFFIGISFIFLSVFNPFGNLQPRYLSNVMMIFYVSLFYTIFMVFHKKSWILISIVSICLLDLYALPAQLSLTYGKELPRSMLVSESWKEFPDTKSHVLYANNHAKEEDIIITLQPKGHSEIYSSLQIDYFLRTNNYESEGHKDGTIWYDDYSKIPMIVSAAQFKEVLQSHAGKTIWVISSQSELPAQHHIDQETADILVRYGTVVYSGKDKYSKLYMITIPSHVTYE